MRIIFHFLVLFFVTTIGLLANDKVITIFHTNDVHGHVFSSDTDIGYAKLASYIKAKKAQDSNVLYLDGGDTLHGTVFAVLDQGNSIVDVLNAVGLDAMVAGNHDFNYGYQNLITLSNKAKFGILSANTVYQSDNRPFLKTNMIKQLPNGIKVGIFGISTPETAYKTSPRNIQGVKFLSPEVVAKEQVRSLKKQGADVIIALSHLGLDKSTAFENSSTILASVEGVDIVVDGHSHTLLTDGQKVKGTFIVQAGDRGRYLGEVTLRISENGGKFISYKQVSVADMVNVTDDEAVAQVIESYKTKQDTVISESVAVANVDLIGEREVVRAGESNLGMLTADAMKQATGADFAILNGGSMRASISRGNVSLADILKVYPFSNIVSKTEIKGSEIKEILEISVNALPDVKGGFLHVSGLTFKVDTKQPAGSRVSDILVNGNALLENKVYTVAVPDFILAGGDNYVIFRNKKAVASYSTLEDILYNYIKTVDLGSYNFSKRIEVSN